MALGAATGVAIVGTGITTAGAGVCTVCAVCATGSGDAGFVGIGSAGGGDGSTAVVCNAGEGGAGVASGPGRSTGISGFGASIFGGSTCAFASADANTMEQANGMATSEDRI